MAEPADYQGAVSTGNAIIIFIIFLARGRKLFPCTCTKVILTPILLALT